jgi:hypothetical protein
VLKATVTVRLVAPESVTVKVAPSPSRPVVSLIESDGSAFLSTIVPSASGSTSFPGGTPVGADSASFTVSFSSLTPSLRSVTSTVFAVSPGAKLTVPLAWV